MLKLDHRVDVQCRNNKADGSRTWTMETLCGSSLLL